MRERKRFTGTYRDETGARVTFHVDAWDFADAELAAIRIGASGEIDGELIEEGDGAPFQQVGHA